MYKIYINEVACLLISTDQLDIVTKIPNDKLLTTAFIGKRKELLNIIDMCEKKCKFDTVIIHHPDLKALIEAFESLFTLQVAAGGLINNEEGQFLFIYRRGSWDLPKGKVEKNETIEQAAIREVEEETGITQVVVGRELTITFHAFRDKKDRRVIKKSHWYTMHAPNQQLVPQTEEDIEMASWIDLTQFLENYKPVYKNILDVIHAYQSSLLS